MKKIFAVLILLAAGSVAFAQTNTPTSTNTPSNTPTNTPSRTPTPFPPGAGAAMGVPSGAAVSAWMVLNPAYVYTVTVFAPGTLAETATFDLSDDAGATQNTVQQVPGTDSTVAAAKVVRLTDVYGGYFRIKLNGNAAAARAFRVYATQTGVTGR